ncbi:MAG TPA: hypothetical protein VK971_03565 [Thiohalobacter sp.]|nr:hypothetical protein [Thiohalobacter sp.]
MRLDVDLKPLTDAVRRMYALPADEGRFVIAGDRALHPGIYTLCAALAVADRLQQTHGTSTAILALHHLDDQAQARLDGVSAVTFTELMADPGFRPRPCPPLHAARLGLEFTTWYELYEDELWCMYHETGACYDQPDYERWLERRYDAARPAQR